MPLKGLLRGLGGGSESGGSESGSSHSGGGRRESTYGGGRRETTMGKMARVLLPLGSKKDRGADRPYFNPEEHISQKREWSRRYTQQHEDGGGGSSNGGMGAQGTVDRLFEHFAVVGLPPDINIREVAADIKTYQRLNRAAGGSGNMAAAAGGLEVTADTPREERQRQYGLKGPALQAEVLYTFPSAPTVPPDLVQSLAAFCFPHGVRPELLERTPSMSALNEVIYSQPYQTHDDHSFVFLMKVTDPTSVTPRTLYGVCCYVRELVHRPPSVAREAYLGCNAPLSRYLVVAPRCYCLLTHHPFFALHFRVLQTILGLERLERMTSFAAELAGLSLDSQVSPTGTSSLRASSAGGPSAASTPSVNQLGQAASPRAVLDVAASVAEPAAVPATAAAAAAADLAAVGVAAAGVAEPASEMATADEESGSEGSSRRWTEGSGCTAAEEQPVDGLAGALQQLALEPPQLPSHRGQVSPHCLQQQEKLEGVALLEEALREGAQPGAVAVTPPDNLIPAVRAGQTPFFTPAGLSSAIGTSATRAQQWAHEQQDEQQDEQAAGQEQRALQAASTCTAAAAPAAGVAGGSPQDSSNGIRRMLEGSLDEAGSSSNSPFAAAAPAAGAAVAAGSIAGDAGSEQAPSAMAPAAGSRRSSRAGSRQRHYEQHADGYDSGSDADSYLTASSSTALLGQDASPLLAASRTGSQQPAHARSMSGSALPISTALMGADGVLVAGAADSCQQAVEAEADPPLVQLDQTPAADLPPLLQFAETEQQERQQGPAVDLPPLLQLDQPPAAEQRPQQAQQRDSGVGVQIVTRSVSSSSMAAAAVAAAATPPRADLLTGAALSRSARHQPLAEGRIEAASSPAPAGAADSAGQVPSEQLQRQQRPGSMLPPPPRPPRRQQQRRQAGAQDEGQQEAVHEVVRVTATNLDMSRPLCSIDLLSVYHASVVPHPGQVFEFQPDPGLQTICFERPDLVEAVQELGLRPNAASLPDIDAAQNLGGWAVAALCRSMSLDNVVTFLTAALLERQIVVFCPNAGVLSGIVLSLVPLLLPFHWQCLLLPVLPAGEGRLELMEAPVPFVLGVLYKTPEVRSKCGGLVRVNVYKDKIKNVGNLPQLPQQAALTDALAGSYSELRKIGLTRTATTRPVHMISDAQQVLAECFLSTLQKYLKGLMADLPAYCITEVSATKERTSVLLKESFIDSFPSRDRPFISQFVETQMFSVYCDAVT